jgi:hypothetical protein
MVCWQSPGSPMPVLASNCNNRTFLLQELMRSVLTDSFGQYLNDALLPQEMDCLGSSIRCSGMCCKNNWQVIQ